MAFPGIFIVRLGTADFAAYLADSAGKALQANVSIDSIVPSFFHRIRLLNVQVLGAVRRTRYFKPEKLS